MTSPWKVAGAALGILSLALVGCGPQDPHGKVLEERGRWSIHPKGFVVTDDGRIKLSVSISGPARSTLSQLSFRVDLKGQAGEILDRRWQTVDLARVTMGTAADFSLDLGTVSGSLNDISIDRVLAPGPEDKTHIKELQF